MPMTAAQFRDSLGAERPPAMLDPALQALWWIKHGEWGLAHGCAQEREGDPRCDWVHAHLHRIEGDQGNAAYWYRRARRPAAIMAFDDEWQTIVETLCG